MVVKRIVREGKIINMVFLRKEGRLVLSGVYKTPEERKQCFLSLGR